MKLVPPGMYAKITGSCRIEEGARDEEEEEEWKIEDDRMSRISW